MNLKERGITVGDLLLILIFVISAIFIITKVKKTDKGAFFQFTPNEILLIRES